MDRLSSQSLTWAGCYGDQGATIFSASLLELYTFRVWLGDVETGNLDDGGNRAQCDGSCLMAWQKCAMQHMLLIVGTCIWPGCKHATGKCFFSFPPAKKKQHWLKMISFADMREDLAQTRNLPRFKLGRAASLHYKKWFLCCMPGFSGHAPRFLTSIFEDASWSKGQLFKSKNTKSWSKPPNTKNSHETAFSRCLSMYCCFFWKACNIY